MGTQRLVPIVGVDPINAAYLAGLQHLLWVLAFLFGSALPHLPPGITHQDVIQFGRQCICFVGAQFVGKRTFAHRPISQG